MKFDKGDRFFEDELFQYIEDPIITSAESGVASQIKIPKGIPAGGIKISVTGHNLAYIQKPQMYVYYEGKMFVSVSEFVYLYKTRLVTILLQQCTVLTNTSMVCDSPMIEADESKLDADNPMQLEYGFIMDNVAGVQNLTSLNKGFSPFLLYPNPVFKPFDKEVKYYKSDYLNINVSVHEYFVGKSLMYFWFGSYRCSFRGIT